MILQDITPLITAFGVLLVILGGGMKWLLTHIDAKTEQARLVETEARGLLSERLNEDIRSLRTELDSLRKEKGVFLRRVYQLESFIHALEGIDIPHMEGWPPE